MIWADDPKDGLLPLSERLGVLSAFANQATTTTPTSAGGLQASFGVARAREGSTSQAAPESG